MATTGWLSARSKFLWMAVLPGLLHTPEAIPDKPEYRGYLNMAKAKLVRQINEIHDAGLQMGIHAIGDAAIVLVVDTLA